MTDREIDILIGQIDEMAQRVGCRFVPDPDKLMAFRCAQREEEAVRDHYWREIRRLTLGNKRGTSMECIVVYRTHGGKVDAVRDDLGELAVYKNRDAAIADNDKRSLFKAVPWQIVELEEL